jgi:Tc toxin complex TcA C-terminal TcB-binding domain/Neuraminidase-like domain/Putative peptidoglycan binding domain/Salmonella virulence plasmid 28.1kDa A protein
MKIGLKVGRSGADVERLQRALIFAGHEIADAEIERREFGPATLSALQAFQSRRGLRRTKQINRATLEILLELEQNITIDINEGKTPAHPRDRTKNRGIVNGKLVDGDGTPIANRKVTLFEKHVRAETQRGHATTDKSGKYSVHYRRPYALTLFVQATDADDTVIATSATYPAAPTEVEINLTTATDGVVRSPSSFTTISAAVAGQLQGVPLTDLHENKDTHELQFLASAASLTFDDVAYLYIAESLASKNQIALTTLFGLFHQGIPASLDAALSSLPDAGIDDTFMAQVLSGVLAQSRSSLNEALTPAVNRNVLPASYAATQDSELTRLDALRTQSVGDSPYIRGKTSLNDLLTAGAVTDAVKSAFIQAFADNGSQLGPTWTALSANKDLPAADLATLKTTLSLGELLTGNLTLIKHFLSRLSQKSLASVQDLALFDQNGWITYITGVDPLATSIPKVLPDDPPQQRIARFAKTLAARFAGRYPTTAFAGGLSKAQTSAFKTKDEIVAFITANPKLSFQRTNIDKFIADNKATISAPALAELKTAQRLSRISPQYVAVEALKSAGYQSAQSIYFKGRDPFLKEMTEALGSASVAKLAYGRAQMVYATALAAFGRYNGFLNGVGLGALGPSKPDPTDLTNLPDLQALFGSLDYFQCEDCQSVYSPAAYLVDLLQYLGSFPASGAGVSNAREALFLRRPEIQYIALNCNNTNIILPYIDLVNEILESAIAPPTTPVTFIDTVGTSDERRALPQQISQAAYDLTARAVFPITLPFDLAFAQTTAYLAALGISRAAILALFAGSPVTPSVAPGIHLVGINPTLRGVINPFGPSTSPGIHLVRSGINPILGGVINLGGSSAVPGIPLVRVGINPILGGAINLGDQSAVPGIPLVGPGIPILGGVINLGDQSVAPEIAGAQLGINPALRGVINGSDTHAPWERWGFSAQNPLDPPGVIDPKTGQPYSPNPTDWVAALRKVPLLLNRAGLSIQQLYQLLEVVWVTQRSVTLQPGTYTGTQTLNPDTDEMIFTGLTGDVLDRANRFLRLWTVSGLQMWELDWALGAWAGGLLNDEFIIFLSGAIAVQSQLKLPFQEVLSFWMPLETRDVTNHLGDEDTVALSTYSELFRNAAVLAATGGVFVALSQSVITGASNTTPIFITTAVPHGYQSGTQVLISGILGNTAANGTFSIKVGSDPTSFTLNGSVGNGDWTGGGVIMTTGTLSGNKIILPLPLPPTPSVPTLEQKAIAASLALSADDITAILAFTGVANSLSLTTLNVLLQYQRLSSSLSLNISDLILWIQLTNGKPFGGTPDDTLEFCRRLSVLQGTGLTAQDLDYLMRDQSATRSSLAFTTAQATTVLQAIRDAIAKLPAATTTPITGASKASPIVITTAQPSGLQTGAVVSISGVLGNTAANGTFNITVSGLTSFSLNGSSGNGDWTSGGVITTTPYDATTIQAIFVSALATATGTTANVVTPTLLKTGVLPLDSSTIAQLVAQTSSVDPTKFPTLVQAFTAVAKAAALFTALKPTESEFAFVVQNAATFNWFDPSAMPLAPTNVSPYAQFESLLRALKLDQRQPARTPKLFDILAQWLPPNPLPTDLNSAISGPTINVAGASNTSPIAITTASPHGLQTGTQVTISGVIGNTAANGVFTITVTGVSTFTLNGSTGNGAWISAGTVTVPYLALALNGSVNDVLAIANKLNASPPGLTPATLPGSLADMAVLTSIAAALDLVSHYGISGTTLVQLANIPANSDTASAAIGALQSQYAQSDWFGAIQPVEDALRQSRRDALVAYLLGPGPATPTPLLLTTDDIFNYYLIDPEMCPCARMTRLLQASLAIQQFVQQCFLNLFFSGVSVDMSNTTLAGEWSWRQQYRLWQANREVFLYPENYLLPELRKDASPFFTDLENDMRQSSYTTDNAEAALENYLRKLVGVARLQVAAHYNETRLDGSTVLHVFARTRATPAQWYYRTRGSNYRTDTSLSPGAAGSWSAWQSLNLDIASQHLLPVIWDQRLHLIWPVFKEISEKQSDQSVPTGGGGSSPAPEKFWAVEFAMSELSVGQWQAKKTITQKLFFQKTVPKNPKVKGSQAFDRPALAFTFRARQDPSFNLLLDAYYNASSADIYGSFFLIPAQGQVAAGTLAMPEAPMLVVEALLLPDPASVDSTQEPTYALVTSSALTDSLTAPSSYFFSGQDLVYGDYATQYPQFPAQKLGVAPLNVLCTTSKGGQPGPLELLGTITNPRIIVPAEEPVFDSTDPFFVADDTRTYLVEPQFYTISSSPQQLPSLKYVSQWSTMYVFETFYHPYARTLLRELEIGGVPQLMARNLQVNPQTVRGWTPNFDFKALYDPQPPVVTPYPGAAGAPDVGESALDFAAGSSGAYSLYNWELFYHVPMFVASLLLQNQQFQDALTWLEYIFNPTDSSGGPAPQRFWQMAPLNALNKSDWWNQEIQKLLTTGANDPATATAITNWMLDPFDPHAVASTRIAAYGKATVMKFLDVLLAWGDWYYSQYTAEKVSQAEQLYIFADMIYGPQADKVRLPSSQGGTGNATYASLKNIDLFSNAFVHIENVVIAPEPPMSVIQGTAKTPSLPQLPGGGDTLLFCIPPNDQLLAYKDKISQRLYNIRHCLNIQGVPQPLPLYAPPINPLQLIEAAASGSSFFGAAPAAPIYRFAVYLQRAVDLTNDVRAYAALILSALEKQDAETLAVIRANQELDIQTRMLDVKNLQVTEAQDQITALNNQQAVVQIRYDFYSNIAFMNAWETAAIVLQTAALIANELAVILDMTSGTAHLLPRTTFGVCGFGGSPVATITYGGENVASAASSDASAIRGLAGILTESGGIAATIGGYQRRMDDWTLQANLASAELTQIKSQITAATDRLNIASKEVEIQNAQISNAQAVSDFLTNKYTNADLYNWMVSQLTTVYTQAYQLAFSLALQAQNAYQYELGSQDTFIQFGYWDSQHKGLTAGESLLFDLRRMETQYLAQNSRELELTKHISLALTQPMALVMLRETGMCQIVLNEILFENDHPGQYFRRLRSVALTIPCVTGPYTGVNATLSLTNAMVRTQAAGTGNTPYQPQDATAACNDPSTVFNSPMTAAGTATIATSSGQNDAGLFDVNLRDDRWLPFEGQGVISTWDLLLDPRDNNFDFTTITDVVLHVRYTARGGGDQAAKIVRTALKPLTSRSILVSIRNTFCDAYSTFFNPPDTTATQQTLTLPMTNILFPFSNLGTGVLKIEGLTYYVVLSVPATGNDIQANFAIGGGAAESLALSPDTSRQTTAGDAIQALTGTPSPSPSSPVALPQSFTVTVPAAKVPQALGITVNGQTRLDPAKIEDILLIVTYSIS